MGTMEIVFTEAAKGQTYSLENKENWKGRVALHPMAAKEDPLIREVERLAFDSWNALGCRDGGRIDIRCDLEGKPSFIEVNPLAGLRPEYSDLPILCDYFGTSYVRLIQCILNSACRRMGGGVGK
jgi:D-alanine-D-alanine ligase